MTGLRRRVLTQVAQLLTRWDHTGRSTLTSIAVSDEDRIEHIDALLRGLRRAVGDGAGSRAVLLLALAGQSVSWLESLEDEASARMVAELVEVMES